MKLTDEEVKSLFYESSLRNRDGQTTHKLISKEYDYSDLEKAYIKWNIIAQELGTSTYWKTIFYDGEYSENENVSWYEVFPKEKTITIYE